MKFAHRVLCLSIFSVTTWGCSAEPTFPLGGQAGDDGDFVPTPPGEPDPHPDPVPPGVPPIDNCEPEERTLAADAATVFGATAEALLASVAQMSSPLFWVPFDSLPGSEYGPGPSEASLSITLKMRAGDIEEVARTPRASDTDARCAPSIVTLPVSIRFETADGALDEVLETDLVFQGPTLARFEVELPIDDLQGGFSFTTVGKHNPGEVWRPDYLYIEALVWPGGSQGRVQPGFTLTNPPKVAQAPPPMMTPHPNSSAGAPNATLNATSIPEHWSDVAVWPTRERCERGGAPLPTDARQLGFSAKDAFDALVARNPWTLKADGGQGEIRFELEPLPALICGAGGPQQSLSFEARATLSAPSASGSSASQSLGDAGAKTDAATAGSGELQGLNATAVYEVWAIAHPTEPRMVQLHFHRRVQDVIYDTSRAGLESATGLKLDVRDEYQRFWWTWQGSIDVESGARSAELIVTSLNAKQSAAAAKQISQGGPGVGVGSNNDGWSELPGDVVLRAAAPD